MRSKLYITAAIGGIFLSLAGCNVDGLTAACGPPTTTPDPTGGLFPESELPSVSLHTDRQATVYFTLDGTPPKLETANCKNGPTFCGDAPIRNIPIVFDGMVLQFFAVDRCGNQERVKSASYRLDKAPVTVADPPPGLYNTELNVRLTSSDESTAPVTVFWTTDGSDPAPNGVGTQSATSPVTIPLANSTTLKWAGEDRSGNREAVKTGQYTVDTIPPISVAEPGSGLDYTSPLSVQLRIINDTGTLFYTTNGAEPRTGGDAQGHTKTASLQTTLTLNKSTFLRFTSIDKAGNKEHDEDRGDVPPLYNEEVYILDDLPAIIASPPGGSYPESELTITLTAAPASQTQIKYRIDGGSEITYSGPFTIQGGEGQDITLTATAQRTDQVLSSQITEIYQLGATIATETFVEDFSTTNFIDLENTTAKIDTAAQQAELPDLSIAVQEERIHSLVGPIVPAEAWSAAIEYDGIIYPQGMAVIDGSLPNGFTNVQNETGAGLKFYTWGDNNDPDIGLPTASYFVSAPTGPDPAQILAMEIAERNIGGDKYLVALDADNRLLLFSDPNTFTGTVAPLLIKAIDGYRPFGPKVDLLAQTTRVPNLVFATEQAENGDNRIAAWDIDPSIPSATRVAAVTLTTDALGAIVGLAFDFLATPAQTTVLALTNDCQLYRARFANISAPTTTLVNTNACPGTGSALISTLVQFSPYVFISYVENSSGNTELAVINGQNFSSVRTGVLDNAARPPGPAWSMAFLTNLDEPMLALSGGFGGTFLYDLRNPNATVFSHTNTLLPSGTDKTIDGLAAFSFSSGQMLVGTQRDPVFFPGYEGGFKMWKLQSSANSAVVQSTNINTTGSDIRSIKVESTDPAGATLLFSTDGSTFNEGPLASGQVVTLDPAATELYWRSTLAITGTTELKNINLKLGLAQ